MSDINNPVSDQEVADWMANLTEADQAELRRQQLLAAAIAKGEPKQEPNWKGMSNQEFHKTRMDKYGF